MTVKFFTITKKESSNRRALVFKCFSQNVSRILTEIQFIGNQYELYVSTVFTVLAILLFSIANPLKINIPILNKIGRNYATFIFVGHEFVIWLLERILPDSFPHKTEAFSVFILTLTLGYFFKKLKRFFQSV